MTVMGLNTTRTPITLWCVLGLFMPLAAARLAAQLANSTNIYSTSFEASEGYHTEGGLVGQNGWLGSGSGGDGIVTNTLLGQLQSAYIGFNPPTNGGTFHAVGYAVDFRPLDRQLPLVTFSVQMALFPSTTTNQEWFDWTVYNTDQKRLFALEFPTGSGNLPVYYKLGDDDYVATGQTYTDGVSYTLTVAMDFAANRWSATLGSTVLVTNQVLAAGTNALTLAEVDADWFLRDGANPGNDYLVFDQYQITAAPAPAPAATTVYSTSFEASEGYHTGVGLVGQNGWLGSGSGGDGIVTNTLLGQLQSAYIGFNPPTNGGAFHAVGYAVDFRPLDRQLPLVTFSVQMAVFPSTTTNQEWFDWTVYNTDQKRLFALEFPTGSGNLPVYYKLGDDDYVATGQTYTDGVSYTLTVAMDFAANRWSATLGSTMLVTNQVLAAGTNALTLAEVDADWFLRDGANPGNDYLVFDQYQIAATAASGSTAPPTLQLQSRAADGTVTLRLVGESGTTYTLEASPDLTHWTQIGSLSSASGTSQFTDPNAANQPMRFYRAHSTAAAP